MSAILDTNCSAKARDYASGTRHDQGCRPRPKDEGVQPAYSILTPRSARLPRLFLPCKLVSSAATRRPAQPGHKSTRPARYIQRCKPTQNAHPTLPNTFFCQARPSWHPLPQIRSGPQVPSEDTTELLTEERHIRHLRDEFEIKYRRIPPGYAAHGTVLGSTEDA